KYYEFGAPGKHVNISRAECGGKLKRHEKIRIEAGFPIFPADNLESFLGEEKALSFRRHPSFSRATAINEPAPDGKEDNVDNPDASCVPKQGQSQSSSLQVRQTGNKLGHPKQ